MPSFTTDVDFVRSELGTDRIVVPRLETGVTTKHSVTIEDLRGQGGEEQEDEQQAAWPARGFVLRRMERAQRLQLDGSKEDDDELLAYGKEIEKVVQQLVPGVQAMRPDSGSYLYPIRRGGPVSAAGQKGNGFVARFHGDVWRNTELLKKTEQALLRFVRRTTAKLVGTDHDQGDDPASGDETEKVHDPTSKLPLLTVDAGDKTESYKSEVVGEKGEAGAGEAAAEDTQQETAQGGDARAAPADDSEEAGAPHGTTKPSLAWSIPILPRRKWFTSAKNAFSNFFFPDPDVIIGVWKPINMKKNPVLDYPLCMVDARSVDVEKDTRCERFVETSDLTEQLLRNRKTMREKCQALIDVETLSTRLAFSERHKFGYFGAQTDGEALFLVHHWKGRPELSCIHGAAYNREAVEAWLAAKREDEGAGRDHAQPNEKGALPRETAADFDGRQSIEFRIGCYLSRWDYYRAQVGLAVTLARSALLSVWWWGHIPKNTTIKTLWAGNCGDEIVKPK
mmetsp:Transcript_27774/g.70122  ORF Transcript_27774/g.70122 Transcript_27774/m.70122 type:complete len:508 (+) Transcript_27774:291-1814(+)|eukprot:g11582.t1